MTTAPPRRRRRLAPLLAAAASLLLSAPAAVLAQDGVDDDAAVGSLPTVYASTQSAAGHMFDVRPKKDLVVYGLEVNVIRLPDPVDVLVYTKAGSHAGSEGTEGDWTLWLNATVESFGLDRPTPVPQRPSASDPVAVARGETRAFYVALGGPYLRYSEGERLYYQNRDLVLFGSGSAKRQGWRGVAFSPRTFNGAVHYWLGTDLGAHPPLLPGGYTMEPTGTPTDTPSGSPSAHPSGSPSAAPVAPPSGSPSLSAAPTVSAEPTADPTATPTGEPSRTPTEIPTGSPIETERFESVMEGSDTRPVYVYAGAMFDLRAKTNVEVTTVAFNTYKFTPIPVWLYMRPGGFGDVEDTLEGWTLVANTTVTGRGMGNPTYIPEGTFSPVLVRKGTKIGFYVTTDGPFLRSSMGTEQGKPYRANSDLVLYEGVGKRYPVENGSGAPRIFNGVVGYQYATIPTSSPTIDLGEFGIRVVEHTFPATDDTFVQRGVATGHGDMTQLRVDGVPERVALMRFDLEGLNGHRAERHRPRQIISAVLRLYAIADSGFGGTVEAYPDGELDGSTATWDTVPYGTERGDAVGVVGSVHDPATGTQLERTGGVSSGTHYEVDIGRYLDANLSRTLVLAVRSDSDDGVMYRSSDSAPDGRGPALVVTFAYDPRDSPAMARTWGTDQPTSSPTVDPRWEDSVMPADAGRRFFNYDVGGVRGPESWGQAEDDGYYDQFRRLKTSRWSNKCGSGRRQSPRDVCQTNAKCQEFHETRPRRGQYGLVDDNLAKPTALIHHNKLRLAYKERRSEWDRPEPPGCDFAWNGQDSGIQDLLHVDLKVRSEHRICGKQYDAEMQQYYLHKYGNLEAVSILIDADGEHNAHFQVLLDYFQEKFDRDSRLCENRRRGARALLEERASERRRLRGGDGDDEDEDASEGADAPASGGEGDAGPSIYRRLHDAFLSLTRRREQRRIYWDPLEPGAIYRSIWFWAYSGSTTEPPCFEEVKWRVHDVPMKITKRQLVQLKRLMFDHVDPDTCRKTSTHYDESNARPVQTNNNGALYRCTRNDYASDDERKLSGGKRKGFNQRKFWRGVNLDPFYEPEFPNVSYPGYKSLDEE